jgi:ATP-binding cassette subfamily B (MDR/TAP) protein 1
MSDYLEYICDPDGTLRWRIGVFSLYYIALATGILITVFLATTLWNLSAYRQIHRLRRVLYHSILRQEIGWFDSVETGVLSTRLVE